MGSSTDKIGTGRAATSSGVGAGERLSSPARLGQWLAQALGGQGVLLILLAAVIGVAGGYGAILFRLLIELVNRLAFPGGTGLDQLLAAPWWCVVLAPPAGGLVVGPLVYFFAREAKGHGVPEVMDACIHEGGRIRPRVAAIKILASALCIGSGGSVGREGPIVQIGSSLGSSLGQLFGIDGEGLKTLVACGAAAGIAATFNAPIAGILFATELLLGRGSARVFSPLVVASVLATVITRIHLGNSPAFKVAAYELVSPWELVPYLLLGALGAVVGVGFTRGLYALEDLWDRVPLPEYSRAMCGGALVGVAALWLPQVMGVGYEFIEEVLHWDSPHVPLETWSGPALLGLLVVVKVLATGTTIGSGGSGGIFAPSLFIGTCLGGAFGAGVNALAPVGTVAGPGAYALVGMGTVVAATTHAPLTAVLIVFELTNRYSILLPLMLSCFLASVIAMRLCRESIYTLKLIRRGSHVSMGRDVEVMTTTAAESLVQPVEATVYADTPLFEVVELVVEERHSRMYVADAGGRLLGVITMEDVAGVIREQHLLEKVLVAADLMKPPPGVVWPGDSVAATLELFSQRLVAELPVVDRDGGLVGVIGRGDIIAHYNREVFCRDAVLNFEDDQPPAEGKQSWVQLGTGEVVEEIPVGGQLEGRTIKELDLRARFGVTVFAVKNGGGQTSFPRADSPLRAGQQMEVFGPRDQVRRVRDLAESRDKVGGGQP